MLLTKSNGAEVVRRLRANLKCDFQSFSSFKKPLLAYHHYHHQICRNLEDHRQSSGISSYFPRVIATTLARELGIDEANICSYDNSLFHVMPGVSLSEAQMYLHSLRVSKIKTPTPTRSVFASSPASDETERQLKRELFAEMAENKIVKAARIVIMEDNEKTSLDRDIAEVKSYLPAQQKRRFHGILNEHGQAIAAGAEREQDYLAQIALLQSEVEVLRLSAASEASLSNHRDRESGEFFLFCCVFLT